MEMIYSCVMGCEVEYEPPIDYNAYDKYENEEYFI